jgi:hypothetical protein
MRASNTADRKVAPFGLIVRTNFAYTSPDYLEGGGFIRLERMSHLAETAQATGQLTFVFKLQQAARDLNQRKTPILSSGRCPAGGSGPAPYTSILMTP